jgi:ankyrin repeat protein
MWAISFGQTAAAQALIENGADISTKSKALEAKGFNPMLIEGFNNKPVAVNPEGGYTPLMFAARTGDLDIARLLVDRGANVNEIHSAEGSALVIAAAEGHEDLAIYLLEHGADPNHADDGGMTALHFALRDGLKVLHGISITNATQLCGLGGDQVRLRCKPLDQATAEELADLEKPVSRLFIVEDAGIEPLPGRNLLKLAEALLKHGAAVNARMKGPPPRFRVYPSENSRFSTDGATPFLLAAAAQDTKAVDLLLQHGADPLLGTQIDDYLLAMQLAPFDPENRIHSGVGDNQIIGTATPLMATVGVGRYNELYPEEEERGRYIAEKLLHAGADINATSVTGWTALHGAAFVGADSLVEFLVKNGAAIDVQNGCGQTPLDLAKGEKTLGLIDEPDYRESTVELLITLGAKSDLPLNPAGECILGRGGRELAPDLELLQKIQAFKKSKADSRKP